MTSPTIQYTVIGGHYSEMLITFVKCPNLPFRLPDPCMQPITSNPDCKKPDPQLLPKTLCRMCSTTYCNVSTSNARFCPHHAPSPTRILGQQWEFGRITTVRCPTNFLHAECHRFDRTKSDSKAEQRTDSKFVCVLGISSTVRCSQSCPK